MEKQLICLALILLTVVSEGAVVGKLIPIKDLSDPTVVDIAKFAIIEQKKVSKVDLAYEKIIKGTTQLVAGTLYDLTITAKNILKDGGLTNTSYEAVVLVKPWEKVKIFQSFKKV